MDRKATDEMTRDQELDRLVGDTRDSCGITRSL